MLQNLIFKVKDLKKSKKSKLGRPIYHFHIRKTGGTSINYAFLKTFDEDERSLYSRLAKSPYGTVSINGSKVTGWNLKRINCGDYAYAFSHIPYHKISLPSNVYKLTCFRDPVERVISHYKMIKSYKMNNIKHPCMLREEPWLGDTIMDFVSRMPKEDLLNQLYMFSEDFNVDEALKNVAKLDFVTTTENLSTSILKLGHFVSSSFEIEHTRKMKSEEVIAETNKKEIKKLLEEEYSFLEQVKFFPNFVTS